MGAITTSPNFNASRRDRRSRGGKVSISPLYSIRITSKVSPCFSAVMHHGAVRRWERIWSPSTRHIQASGRDVLKLPGSIKILCRFMFFRRVHLITEIYSIIRLIKHPRASKHTSRYIPGVNSYYVSRNALRSRDALWRRCSYRGRIASDRSDDSHFVVSHSSENSRLWLTVLQNYRGYPELRSPEL